MPASHLSAIGIAFPSYMHSNRKSLRVTWFPGDTKAFTRKNNLYNKRPGIVSVLRHKTTIVWLRATVCSGGRAIIFGYFVRSVEACRSIFKIAAVAPCFEADMLRVRQTPEVSDRLPANPTHIFRLRAQLCRVPLCCVPPASKQHRGQTALRSGEARSFPYLRCTRPPLTQYLSSVSCWPKINSNFSIEPGVAKARVHPGNAQWFACLCWLRYNPQTTDFPAA